MIDARAARVIREAADNGRPDETNALVAALEAGDRDEIESLVVKAICDSPEFNPRRLPRFPEAGSSPPPFRAPLLTSGFVQGDSSEIVDLEEMRGQVVVLYFWNTWCRPCVERYPSLVRLARDLQDRPLSVYGVLEIEPPAGALRWMSAHEAGVLPTLVDQDRAIANAYGVWGFPRMFVINHDGEMVGACIGCQVGRWGEDSLPMLLESVLADIAYHLPSN